MSEKYKNVGQTLNYFEHFVLFIFAVSGYVLISTFASLLDFAVGI